MPPPALVKDSTDLKAPRSDSGLEDIPAWAFKWPKLVHDIALRRHRRNPKLYPHPGDAPVSTVSPREVDTESPDYLYNAGKITYGEFKRRINARYIAKFGPIPEPPGPIEVLYSASSPPSITPEEVLELMRKDSLPLHGHADGYTVHRITEDLVVKGAEDIKLVEATTMDYVRARTNIPIPTVRLVFSRGVGYMKVTYIVMDCIAGPTLQHLWPTLEEPARTSILAQLRGYINELRSLPPDTDTPGVIDGSGMCYGRWFSESGVGPFPTHAALINWWNRMFPRPDEWAYQWQGVDDRFDTNQRLVFTHGDFNPRNLIVRDGVVWVVDWQYAGWYPWYIDPTQIATDTGSCENPTPEDWAASVLPFFPDSSCELRMFKAIEPNIMRWFIVDRFAVKPPEETTPCTASTHDA